ncbi:MAG TPA: hypothetical protein VMV49_09915 [Candidatus Deferrimicrobium sp.]|nr:hypothetical protein [Candidatus Deferrimicrobium sp.]
MGFLPPVEMTLWSCATVSADRLSRNDNYFFYVTSKKSSTEISHDRYEVSALYVGFLLPAGRRNDSYLFVISKDPRRTRLRYPILNSCNYAIHGISPSGRNDIVELCNSLGRRQRFKSQYYRDCFEF